MPTVVQLPAGKAMTVRSAVDDVGGALELLWGEASVNTWTTRTGS